MKRSLITVFLCFLLATPGWTGMKEAELAYRHGDYAAVLREIRPLAEQGNIGAQLLLGTMYEDGRGVPRDYVQAYKWYSLTSSQGDQTFLILRIRIAEQMTPAQIAKAQKLTREWQSTRGKN
jgi:TPR repeat protein